MLTPPESAQRVFDATARRGCSSTDHTVSSPTRGSLTRTHQWGHVEGGPSGSVSAAVLRGREELLPTHAVSAPASWLPVCHGASTCSTALRCQTKQGSPDLRLEASQNPRQRCLPSGVTKSSHTYHFVIVKESFKFDSNLHFQD